MKLFFSCYTCFKIGAHSLLIMRFFYSAMPNSPLFHLMFGGSKKVGDNSEFQTATQASYKVLQDICAPLAIGKAGQEGNEILVWSIIHGFVNIMLNDDSGRHNETNPKEFLKLIFPKLLLKLD